ncbi:aminomethyltransferase [Sistotremastrum suecicum HHB10207 ss-3]|uniref:Aminomethyltransferase n=1 Tax=Sistotremastrum suecicum HHB10207 ss-3 TaxID=1314776 RepID=A0A166DXC3_9AGAM|nr:aminomethyltransferase [Sistotremastrum suecicum HHB10207 ss-3]
MIQTKLSTTVASSRVALNVASRRNCLRFMSGGGSSELRKTGLYDFHVARGAKMVPFAGYSMPLSYGDIGQVASHNNVRNNVGLFDVGHMVQHIIRGGSSLKFLEWLTPSSLGSLSAYQSTLSVLLNEQGGIIDDTVICRHPEATWYVVTNAGRRDEDLVWLQARLKEWNESERSMDGKVEHEVLNDWGLIALQGPKAAAHLQRFTDFDLSTITFGKAAYLSIQGVRVHVARGGYTGEDGFEISIPPADTVEITSLIVGTDGAVQLAGLGARDSLRLEAGMCLYGHDLDERTSPVEAGLSWLIGKDRRASADFIGAQTVLKHLQKGACPRKRIGLIVSGAPAREGAKIIHPDFEEELGTVTSGIPSPTLGKNIAMGYVKNGDWTKSGSKLLVEVRKKVREAVVTKMPFVPTNYFRG